MAVMPTTRLSIGLTICPAATSFAEGVIPFLVLGSPTSFLGGILDVEASHLAVSSGLQKAEAGLAFNARWALDSH
jgi:hypothetical protein